MDDDAAPVEPFPAIRASLDRLSEQVAELLQRAAWAPGPHADSIPEELADRLSNQPTVLQLPYAPQGTYAVIRWNPGTFSWGNQTPGRVAYIDVGLEVNSVLVWSRRLYCGRIPGVD